MPRFDPQRFIEQSTSRLRNAGHLQRLKWRMEDAYSCTVDFSAQRLVLRYLDDTIATALIQVVGTYLPYYREFRWSWDDRAIPTELCRDSMLVREWATKYSLSDLTSGTLSCDADKCWVFTALTVRLGNSMGGYCVCGGPYGPLVYLSHFSVVSWNERVFQDSGRSSSLVHFDPRPERSALAPTFTAGTAVTPPEGLGKDA